MSHVPPIESPDPARDERPRPRFGEYAPVSDQPKAPDSAFRPEQHEPPAPPAAAPGSLENTSYTESASVFHNAPPPKPKGLGVVAFIVGLVVLVFSLVLSIVAGLAFAPIASQVITDGGTIDQSAISSDDPAVGAFGVLSAAFFFGGTILGLWALVQGIIATIKKRGRAFGIVAMALAVATPVICFVVFYAVTFASAPEIFSSAG